MKTVWIDFVGPGGGSGGVESSESAALMTARRYLTEFESKGLPAAVVVQPLERGGPSLSILKRGSVKVTFNRLGKSDITVKREATRLKHEREVIVEVARRLYDPIDPKEWRAGIARLNMRARTKAISKTGKKTTRRKSTRLKKR